jgi:hypothetical protein
MQLLEANVRASGLSHVCSVQELPWGQASWDNTLAPFDAVLAADVVYREDSAVLLAETISCAIPAGSSAPFLLGNARPQLLPLRFQITYVPLRFYQPNNRRRRVL